MPHHHAVGLQAKPQNQNGPQPVSHHTQPPAHGAYKLQDQILLCPQRATPAIFNLQPIPVVGHHAESFSGRWVPQPLSIPGPGDAMGQWGLTGLSPGLEELHSEGSPGAQLTCRSGSPSTHWNSFLASWRPIHRSKEMFSSMDVMKAARDGEVLRATSSSPGVGAGGGRGVTYPAPEGWRWWPARRPGSHRPALPPATSRCQLCRGH